MKIIKNTVAERIQSRAMPEATARCVLTLITLLVSGILLFGCVSFQSLRRVEGREVVPPGDQLEVGKATLGDVLLLLGAPDKLAELEGKDLLLYERVVLRENRLSFSIPVSDIWGLSVDLTAYGALTRYDILACFFTSDGILQDIVFEKGSSYPYLKTVFMAE